ncbi:MAG: hypothetical protein AB7T06_43675 [Kofleriaceae bacterium]
MGATPTAWVISVAPIGTAHETTISVGESRSTRHRDRRWARTSSHVIGATLTRRTSSDLQEAFVQTARIRARRQGLLDTLVHGTLMGLLDYLPAMPSISEVGEIGISGPSLPALPSVSDYLPSISEVGEIGLSGPSLPALPSVSDYLPSISEVGEIGVGTPHLPSLPSLSDVGAVLPSLPFPISEVGEVSANPIPLTPHTSDERRAMHDYGAMEAERGLDRHERGENVVGIGGDDSPIGEDGGLFPTLFGGSEEMQEFGRLHDIEAALAEKEGGGAASDPFFRIANGITAAVGGAVVTGAEIANMVPEQYGGTVTHPGHRRSDGLDSGGLGAAAANRVWEFMGYSTGDYEGIEHEAIARRQT